MCRRRPAVRYPAATQDVASSTSVLIAPPPSPRGCPNLPRVVITCRHAHACIGPSQALILHDRAAGGVIRTYQVPRGRTFIRITRQKREKRTYSPLESSTPRSWGGESWLQLKYWGWAGGRSLFLPPPRQGRMMRHPRCDGVSTRSRARRQL